MNNNILIAVIAFLCSCGERESNLNTNDIEAIEEMSKDRAVAFNSGDARRISDHFTVEGILMAPGKSVARGKKAVEEYYAGIFREYETVLESYYDEVEVSGGLGFGRGEAKVMLISRQSGDTTYSSSKYLNIVQKQSDGTWKTTHDIWNGNE